MDFTKLKQKDTASAMGVTRESIRQWEKSGMPRNEDGTYHLPDCIRWREDRARDEVVEPEGDGDKWLSRYRMERALITAMEREQMEKKLVPLEQVESAFTDRAYELSRGMLNLSRRVGQRIAGKAKRLYSEVVDVIDEEVRMLLADYSRPISIECDPIKK